MAVRSLSNIKQVTTTVRDALTTMVAGTVILNQSTKQFERYSGTIWEPLNGLEEILVFESNPGPSGVAGTPMFDVVFVVPGLLATDTLLSATQKTAGASGTLALLGWIDQVDNGLTGKYVADPGTGSVILVAVKR